MTAGELHALALIELGDVGDRNAGEWWEFTGRAGHLRRRLGDEEAETIGPVIDIRGTPEATHRISQVLQFVPREMRRAVMREAAS